MAGFDKTNPTDNAIVSQYPSNERAQRAAVASAFGLEHDSDGAGRHKFTRGNTSARDAITTWVDGSLYVNTSASSATPIIEIYTSAASSWSESGRFTSADEVKLDGIATAAEVNAVQVSANEISAGTLTSVRSYSPANIVSFVSTHTPSPILSESFISAEQTISAGGALTLAHSLSSAPRLVLGYLICKSSEIGYTTGDVVLCMGGNDATTRGYGLHSDGTNIKIKFATETSPLRLVHGTAGSLDAITLASWKLIIYAWV